VNDGNEICGRCLVLPNVSSSVIARWGDNQAYPPNPQNPRAMKIWCEEMLYGNRARFEINAMSDCVEAISTWHGDPVCSVHLWTLVSEEMRGVKYR
jgi:hypothetical protein